jgi:hypothetical protein
VSARAGAGRSAIGSKGSPYCAPEGWAAMVVGSIAPLSLMDGGVFAVIRIYVNRARQRLKDENKACRAGCRDYYRRSATRTLSR